MTAAELVADAEGLLAAGRREEAIAACLRALEIEPDCLPAHACLARAKLPGDDYLAHLRRFHEALSPRVYLEIGVDAGRTLSLARPPTRAIGVDPSLRAEGPAFVAPTRLYAMESDVFFASGAADRALGGAAVDLAFVDGLHLFEQALRDFIHVEKHAAHGSVALFHDCLPLDAATSSRERHTGFWTGDVWKLVPILQRHRPDLDAFLIPAYPTGLLVVTRLDPASRDLERDLDEIVAGWIPREWAGGSGDPPLPLVPNDWPAVADRLRSAR